MARPRVPVTRRDSRPARTPRVAGARQRLPRSDDAPPAAARTAESAESAESAEVTEPGAAARVQPDGGSDRSDRSDRSVRTARRPRPYPAAAGDTVDTVDADAADTADRADPGGEDDHGTDVRPTLPRVWWVVTALAVAAVAAAVLTVVAFLRWQRVEARAAARSQVPSLAKTYAATILSYDYRHIRQDADAAARVTTGEYGRQYRQTMDQLIIPQAQQVHAVVRAEVLGAGVSSVSDDGRQATVLVYANQTVSNDNVRGSRVDQVRVRLTLVRRGDAWRVSKVDPL